MKIAIATATYPPYQGGTGRVCADQARELAARGHRVTVYYPRTGRSGSRTSDNPRVVGLRPLVRLGNAALPPGHLGIERPDLLHLHYPYYGGGDLAWLDATLRRIPYVVTYHQDVELPGLAGAVVRRHHALGGRRLLARARLVMATSLDYARHSRLAPLLARSPGQVVEVPNGVDTTRFTPGTAPAGVRQRYGFDKSHFVVAFVGSLDRAHYFKGVDVLLRAIALLGDCPVRLLVIGRGSLLPAYQRLSGELGIAGRVRFDDAVDDAALPDRCRLANVLALPSHTRGEAFGVVLLEALACGTPVIASDLPGVRAVVARTGGGLLVPPGDAVALAGTIRTLMYDPARRAELGASGRVAVERYYAWPRIIDELERRYRQALLRTSVGAGSREAGCPATR